MQRLNGLLLLLPPTLPTTSAQVVPLLRQMQDQRTNLVRRVAA
jgi:hypothetical protein